MRVIIATLGLLIAGFCLSQSPAQMMSLTGAGASKAIVAGGYTGPGDLVTLSRYWGLRCYSTSYTGNVADVYAPLDASHTLLTCSSGGTINETLQSLATTCAISCTVKTLYDQPNQSGTPQDMVQATEGSRLAFIQNCSGTKPCMRGGSGKSMQVPSDGAGALPIWATYAAKRTGDTSNFNSVFKNQGTGFNIGFASTSGNVYAYAGNVVLATAAESSFHAVQSYVSGAGSGDAIYVDGSNTGSLNAGTTGSSGVMEISGDGSSQNCTCDILEVGFANSDQTANNSAMNSNQHSYWGF